MRLITVFLTPGVLLINFIRILNIGKQVFSCVVRTILKVSTNFKFKLPNITCSLMLLIINSEVQNLKKWLQMSQKFRRHVTHWRNGL